MILPLQIVTTIGLRYLRNRIIAIPQWRLPLIWMRMVRYTICRKKTTIEYICIVIIQVGTEWGKRQEDGITISRNLMGVFMQHILIQIPMLNLLVGMGQVGKRYP